MNENSLVSSGPGVASSLKIKNQQFLFLDDRFYRTPLNVKPQSHFGKEQHQWLIEKIKTHKGPSWLISGDQFFGAYHPFESFAGNHPQDFKDFLKDIKKTGKPVAFISGDRHIAEVIKIEKSVLGYQTFELTSSGLHTKMFPDALTKNPNSRRIFGKAGESNYLELKVDLTTTTALSFEAVFWGEDFKMFFQEKYKVSK
jgi:alkaline phosphatase D